MSDTKSNETEKIEMTAEQFVEKLRNALRKDGDFPASAKIVSELRMLTSDPRTTANQLTEVILREPSLGTRILHLVNSSFYRRAKPIMTVSQAVVQIGMKPLAELCAGLVLLQKFVPVARRGGAFATCLQKTILSSLLSSSLVSESKPNLPSAAGTTKADECGYLAGSFAELGTLLLAYYFPQVYEAAIKRAEQKRVDLQQSIHEITGLSPLQLSLEVVNALDLPGFYKEVLLASLGKPSDGTTNLLPNERGEIARVAKSVQAARDISEVLVTSKNQQELDKLLVSVQKNLSLPSRTLEKIVGELPQVFKKQCDCIELTLPALPAFISNYSGAKSDSGAVAAKPEVLTGDEFMQYVEEIRQAVESGESTAAVITTVMETLAWNIKFDRVLLLLSGQGKKRLAGRMLLGNADNVDPKKIERELGADAAPHTCDAQAFREGRPMFRGDPVIEGGWPLAAIPIGFGQRAIGVIYADRTATEAPELSEREQAAIAVLAELLDRSVGMSS
ncbi:MAG: HDOD domain-containing protein [Deltaproteobacteria bacterium]|nr:HDOD domain-containing protein [Deltaproteobacteria bacterium]